MHHVKSFFIAAYMAFLLLGLVWGVSLLLEFRLLWLGASVLATSMLQMAFFLRLFISPSARTGKLTLWLMASIALVLPAIWMMLGAHDLWGLAALVLLGVALPMLYVHWYSRFPKRDRSFLRVDQTLPALVLTNERGESIDTRTLTTTRAMWLFYRGNWCPLCMAQIREVAANYQALAQRGVAIYLVSPQPPEHTAELAEKFDVPMQFFIDQDNVAACALGILAEKGLPWGLQALGYDRDVPMPTVFITEAGGHVIYADLTDNYRLRPEPQDILAELDRWDGRRDPVSGML